MKSLRTLTLAATLALIGMAGGYAGDARAQGVVVHERPTSVGSQINTGLLLPAVRTTPGDGVADLVVGAGGGKPGEANALIGLLRPGESSDHTAGTLPAVQFPTDQKNGDGRADLVTGAGGGQANGVTKVGPGTLVLNNTNTYGGQTTVNQGVLNQKGSLQRLGSINDLFANSRGGDQSAGAHGAGGGGGAGKVSMQDVSITGDGSVVPTDQIANPNGGGTQVPAVQKVREAAARVPANTATIPADLAGKGGTPPQALLLPAVQAAREAARSSSSAGGSGGGQVATNAVKGINVQNAARK
jgi:autotransporter-associated beta strand protein